MFFQTKERIPTLGEMGGTQLYPEDPTVGMFTVTSVPCVNSRCLSDRRPALQAVLRTLLHTFSSFLSSILAPPPSQTSDQTSDVPPDWQRLVEWMRVMGQNIMGAANDLRPVQVRYYTLCLVHIFKSFIRKCRRDVTWR